MSLEGEIVSAVLYELGQRGAFDHWWDQLDENVRLDIGDELRATVRRLLEDQT